MAFCSDVGVKSSDFGAFVLECCSKKLEICSKKLQTYGFLLECCCSELQRRSFLLYSRPNSKSKIRKCSIIAFPPILQSFVNDSFLISRASISFQKRNESA